MFREFHVQNGETELYCREAGQGESIIFIHGACVDSDFFLDTAEFLAKQFHVVLYDRRGYGRSTAGNEWEVASQIGDTVAVIQNIGSPCHIIAHSAGTTIAMELAARHPELVKSMILHEPVAADCIPPEREDADIYNQIGEALQNGKVSNAIMRFMGILGKADPRAKAATPDEQKNMGKNTMCFFKGEYGSVTSFVPDYETLISMQIFVGVGELSQGSLRWDVAHAIAPKLNAQFLYFPSGHNCARDLPMEFAYLCKGVLI